MSAVYGRMNGLAFELERGIRMEGARSGTYAYHTPAIQCSCNDASGQPLPTCRICGGDGVFHPTSLEKKYLVILSGATNSREMLSGPGIIEREDMVVTFISPTLFPATRDKVRFDRSDLKHLVTPAEPFILTRGTGLYDELPQRVAKLISVVRTNSRAGTYITYRPGVDVDSSGNHIIWNAKQIPPLAGATMPPVDTQYGVTYQADYDWGIVENLAPRHIASVGMRTHALIRRRFVDQRNIDRESPTGPGGFNPGLF